jgi:hypothetical protein
MREEVGHCVSQSDLYAVCVQRQFSTAGAGNFSSHCATIRPARNAVREHFIATIEAMLDATERMDLEESINGHPKKARALCRIRQDWLAKCSIH